MKDTSINTYIDLLKEGKICKQEQQVLDVLNTPLTSRQIASLANMERTSVCGRLNALVKKNVVKEYDVVTCDISGRQVHRYAIVKEQTAA